MASSNERPNEDPLTSSSAMPEGDELDDAVAQDLLVALLARWAEQDGRWADRQDDRFLEWVAREHEIPGDDPDRLSRVDTERIAGEMAQRIRAERAPLRRVERAAELFTAPVTGTISQVLAEAVERGRAPYLDLAVAAGAGRELWDEECEQWVSVPGDLAAGRYVALGVAGESMTPLFHSRDVVLVRLGDEVQPGSIVVARLPDDGFVVKQLGRLTRTMLELESINPEFAPIRVRRSPQTILGTVVLRWCGHGL
jgi:phage repressor protein C with HTH and peptisase S24 domain